MVSIGGNDTIRVRQGSRSITVQLACDRKGCAFAQAWRLRRPGDGPEPPRPEGVGLFADAATDRLTGAAGCQVHLIQRCLISGAAQALVAQSFLIRP